MGGAWNIDYVKVTPDHEGAHSYLFAVDPKKLTLKPGNCYKLTNPEHQALEEESEDDEPETVDPVPNVSKGSLCKVRFIYVNLFLTRKFRLNSKAPFTRQMKAVPVLTHASRFGSRIMMVK